MDSKKNPVEFADKQYYLIDSLNLSDLHNRDSILIDTCLEKYHAATDDTTKMEHLNTLVNQCWNEAVWPKYNRFMKDYCEARLHQDISESVRIKLLKYKADAINNVGLNYYVHGDLQRALENYLMSLKISERLKDHLRMGPTLNNITLIHIDLKEFDKALEYCEKAMAAMKLAREERSLGVEYNNFGLIYSNLGNDSLALKYYQLSLEEYEKFNKRIHMSSAHYNIGTIFLRHDSLQLALQHFRTGLRIAEELNYLANIAINMTYISKVYAMQGKTDSAIYIGERAHQVALKSDYPAYIWRSSLELYHGYKEKAQLSTDYKSKAEYFENSLKMYELYNQMYDSIQNERNKKSLYKAEMKYEYEKQKALDDKENEKRIAVEKEIEHRQQLVIYFVVIIAIGLVGFLIFIVRKLRQTRKQKIMIEEQKTLVDEAYEELNQTNEEILAQRDQIEQQRRTLSVQNETLEAKNIQITDGINYARNIQENLLVKREEVKKYFKNSFVMLRPKDIVSGDFFWIRKRNGLIYFAVVDCTGHGVSASLLSIVCSRLLDKATDRHNFVEAGKMLDYLHAQVIKELKRANETVDGMDISLCIFDPDAEKISFSGAHNSAVIMSKGKQIKLLGDNRPIGFTYKNNHYKDFTSQEYMVERGDIIYLFSDGFYDQFGGPGPKRIKYFAANFDKLLERISMLPVKDQLPELEKTFDEWKGDYEQIDDVCVMGIQV